MKVLHLTTHLNTGGITIYILRLVRHLKKLGVQTHVISSGGDYVPKMREAGAQTLELKFKTKSDLSPKLYAAIPAVIRYIRDNQIDVIHAHTRITQLMAFWIQRFIRIPVVTTCHGFYKKRLGRQLIPAWGNFVIAISGSVAEHLVQDQKASPQSVRTVSNAVDFEYIDEVLAGYDPIKIKEELGFTSSDIVLGVVARLVEDKGHEFLIRAAALLKPQHPGMKVLIVGEGRARTFLESLAMELGIFEDVMFTGNVMNVIRYLAAMDIFVFPATWREGFGLSIVEAMACRKPVIVTNVWALNSLVQNKKTGILVDPKDPQKIADAVSELLTDPSLADRLRQEGRRMAEEMFSLPRMAAEIHGVYQEAQSRQCLLDSR